MGFKGVAKQVVVSDEKFTKMLSHSSFNPCLESRNFRLPPTPNPFGLYLLTFSFSLNIYEAKINGKAEQNGS